MINNIAMNGFSLPQPGNAVSSMKIGSRSSFVEQLQQTLTDQGFNPASNIDGIFGSKTLQAVRDYQLSNSISNPNGNFYGVAGPQTLGSLGLAGSSVVAGASTTVPAQAAQASTSSSDDADSLISSAKRHMGVPYLWGGTTRKGFDCSGLMQSVFAEHGKDLPRTAAQMWKAGTSVDKPEKGDLVFFETRTGPSHVGIYAGDNKFVHAGSSTGVTVTDMDNSYWKSRYLGAKEM
ncbi:C40 family peptidase [Sinobaca sp. H24]|uniref:C40 family peptidase n=1 Tax=Sinobaca sp. H24 TaxID=2923376 RepID=UPI0020795F4E|nr:NlpC/P60 family protein [Sinobaca sp. H24]